MNPTRLVNQTPKKGYRPGYALEYVGVVRYAATKLEEARVADAGLSIEDIAKDYDHSSADLSRVRLHHHFDNDRDATRFLIECAIDSLGDRVERVDDGYRLARPLDEIRYPADTGHKGEKIVPWDFGAAKLINHFDPMSGRFAGNIRLVNVGKETAADVELRESLRRFGWQPHLRAVRDERGVVLVGHRRLAIAKELGIEVREGHEIVTIEFGDDDLGTLRRGILAYASNVGARPFGPEERKEIATWLYVDNDLTIEEVAEMLGVGTSTIGRDISHVGKKDPRGRPRKAPLDPGHALPLTPEKVEQAVAIWDRGGTDQEVADAVGSRHHSSSKVQRTKERIRGRKEGRIAATLGVTDPVLDDVPLMRNRIAIFADDLGGFEVPADEPYRTKVLLGLKTIAMLAITLVVRADDEDVTIDAEDIDRAMGNA